MSTSLLCEDSTTIGLMLPSIRRAVVADADALSSLAAQLFPLGCPPTDPADLEAYISAELTPQRFAELIADPNVVVLVAERGGSLLGYMIIVLRSRHHAVVSRNSAELRKLYLDPALHGSGIAHQIMRAALEILSAARSRTIWLTVYSENPRAISFYLKWGFKIVCVQEFLVGSDPQRDFLMIRDAFCAAEP